MQLTTLWRTPKGSSSKLSTTSCHQPWLRLRQENQQNQQNQQQKVKSSKANGATNAKAFRSNDWGCIRCTIFFLMIGSQICFFNTLQQSNMYQQFMNMFYQSCHVRYGDMSIYQCDMQLVGHGTFLTPRGHHQAALLAMSRPSRPSRPVAKAAQESTAGAMTQMLHIDSIGVIVNYD